MNANVVDASLVRIFELVSGRSTIPDFLNLSDICHVFAIAKVWQASLISFVGQIRRLFYPEPYFRVFEITKTREGDKAVPRQSCLGYLRWSCCLIFG
jgi:hypothetical protein